MKTKHTKGEWEVFSRPSWTSPEDELKILDSVGTILASISDNNRSEREANAKLIAAAPDLLKALELIILENSLSIRGNLLIMAREAIEKATE